MRRLLDLAAGLAGLAAFNWLGGRVAAWLPVRLPGSVLGALLLLAALAMCKRVPRPLDGSAALLLRHLVLFVIPSLVPVALTLGAAREHGVFILLVTTAGTALTAAGCAAAMQAVASRQRTGWPDA
ncbi:MAG: hypothetical protein RJA36_2615 [Pseudomonadota bacterium]|jgi:holin-like protein